MGQARMDLNLGGGAEALGREHQTLELLQKGWPPFAQHIQGSATITGGSADTMMRKSACCLCFASM